MSKTDHNSDSQLSRLEQLLQAVKAKQTSAPLLEQLREPARQLLKAILNDRRRKSQQPEYGIIEFDSSLLPLPEGVRPAAVDVRRLVYRLDDFRVDLSLYPLSSEGWELIGQLVDEEGTITELDVVVRRGRTTQRFRANRFGLFRVPHLQDGVTKLTFETGRGILGAIDLEI